MDLSRAYAPVTDQALLEHTWTYMRGFCFMLAYELAQILEGWEVAQTTNDDDSSALHVFVVKEDWYSECGHRALDIQGLHDAMDLTDQCMADDWEVVDAEEMLAEWTKTYSEDGTEVTDEMHEQAQAVAKALVEHLAADIAG